MPPIPVQDVEITVSFRQQPAGGTCAFVTTQLIRRNGVAEVAFSRHLTGSPERLVDLALALVREQALEGWLTTLEPF